MGVVQEVAALQPDALKAQVALDLGRIELEQECTKISRLAGELAQECTKSGRLAGELERVRVKWEEKSAAFAELERKMKKQFELERAAVLQCLRSQPPSDQDFAKALWCLGDELFLPEGVEATLRRIR